MTTFQPSLFQGDALSQHRFTLCAILEDALRVVRRGGIDGKPASQHDVDYAVVLIGRISAELQELGGEDPVPF